MIAEAGLRGLQAHCTHSWGVGSALPGAGCIVPAPVTPGRLGLRSGGCAAPRSEPGRGRAQAPGPTPACAPQRPADRRSRKSSGSCRLVKWMFVAGLRWIRTWGLRTLGGHRALQVGEGGLPGSQPPPCSEMEQVAQPLGACHWSRRRSWLAEGPQPMASGETVRPGPGAVPQDTARGLVWRSGSLVNLSGRCPRPGPPASFSTIGHRWRETALLHVTCISGEGVWMRSAPCVRLGLDLPAGAAEDARPHPACRAPRAASDPGPALRGLGLAGRGWETGLGSPSAGSVKPCFQFERVSAPVCNPRAEGLTAFIGKTRWSGRAPSQPASFAQASAASASRRVVGPLSKTHLAPRASHSQWPTPVPSVPKHSPGVCSSSTSDCVFKVSSHTGTLPPPNVPFNDKF